jgi:glycosyltransferase involved in cell wall biosynthesis
MKIRYYGHAGQLTGYGRAAEMMITALLRAGADVELRALAPYDTLKFEGSSLPLASHLKRDEDLDPRPDVIIVHTLPMDCPRVVDLASADRSFRLAYDHHRRPTWIAYTTWEASTVRFSLTPYEVFDDVWMPSQRSLEAWMPKVSRDHDGRMFVMPHCFDESLLPFYRERLKPPEPNSEPYRFYAVGAWTARKNPIAILRAFAHAFDKTDSVELLLQCQGMTKAVLTHAVCATGFPPDQLPPIRSDFSTMTESQIWDLHRRADCFVSASRGEAWNLPAFEAMLAGRHVIAPAALGHEEFLAGTSADLYASYAMPAMVDTRMSQEGAELRIQTIGAQGLTSKDLWFEPDVADLAQAMRRAYKFRSGELELDDPNHLDRFTTASVGRLAVNRINLLNVQRNLSK